MSRGTASAFTILRVAHGQPRPTDAEVIAALQRDRERLQLEAEPFRRDFDLSGPRQVTVDGEELDEYVAWER